MIPLFCILPFLLGTSSLSPASTASVADIDLLFESLDQNHLTPSRHFRGTLPPVQGPGYRSWEVFLYEDTEYELIEEIMFMQERLYRIEHLFHHSDYCITTSYFFDPDENPVLCISAWWLENDESPVFEDRFYFSGNDVLACCYDGEPLTTPSEDDIEKGIARLEYAQYILDCVNAPCPGSSPVFTEQFDYVYDNF